MHEEVKLNHPIPKKITENQLYKLEEYPNNKYDDNEPHDYSHQQNDIVYCIFVFL